MRQILLSSMIVAALMLGTSVGYAGAKSNTPAAEVETGQKPQVQVAEAKAEKTDKVGQAPHATGKDRAAEVGQGKKKGLEKQGYEINGGKEKAPKSAEEETEPAVIVVDTSSDKPKTEPKSDGGKKPEKDKPAEPAEQPQENQGGGFGR